jgi:hypothetical protein
MGLPDFSSSCGLYRFALHTDVVILIPIPEDFAIPEFAISEFAIPEFAIPEELPKTIGISNSAFQII